MKRLLLIIFILSVAAYPLNKVSSANEETKSSMGKNLFNQYCIMCHPDGSNIFNAKKSLHRNDLNSHNIKKPEDIINIMRNPGPGMPSFDKDKIPDDFAKQIAEYILDTFK
jgi:cytochrome c6